MNEMTEAGRYDGRSTNGITYSPCKGIWYDIAALSDVDKELSQLLEPAE